jgi:hypothetical protein
LEPGPFAEKVREVRRATAIAVYAQWKGRYESTGDHADDLHKAIERLAAFGITREEADPFENGEYDLP